MMAGKAGSEEVEPQDRSDNDLIRAISNGDSSALEALYDRYNRVVFSFSLRIVSDQEIAEEVMQEVFFKAWKQGASYKSARGSLITWLLSITHNLSIDEVRKRNRRPQKADSAEPETFLSVISDDSKSVEETVWIGELRESIMEALTNLPPAQRKAIELAYFQGLTQREIAESLDEPLGTIKTRMRLGMLKLRDYLSEEMYIEQPVREESQE